MRNIFIAVIAISVLSCSADVSKYGDGVRIGNVYDSLSLANEIQLDMARNDNASICLSFDDGAYTFVRSSRLPSGLEYELRTVEKWLDTDDILVPLASEIENGKKLWLSYSSAASLRPGSYRQVLEFKCADNIRKVAVNLKVWDVTVPEVSSLPIVFGIQENNLEIEGLTQEQADSVRRSWADKLLSYRISPYFTSWAESSMKVENSSSPYRWNDPRSVDYLSDPRFTAIALPIHALNDAQLDSMSIALRKRGLLEKTYYYIWDEAVKMSDYQEIIDGAKRVEAVAPESHVLTTFYCGPKEGEYKDDLFAVSKLLRGYADIFASGVWSLNNSEARSDSLRLSLMPGEQWWTYVCMSDSPGLCIANNTLVGPRVVLWRTYKEGSTGFLFWSVNAYLRGAEGISARPDIPKGDAILVIPGKYYSSSADFVVSMRLEKWRDSAIDYELLKMYEERYGRQAALQLLSTVYSHSLKYSSSGVEIQNFRKKLLEELTHRS